MMRGRIVVHPFIANAWQAQVVTDEGVDLFASSHSSPGGCLDSMIRWGETTGYRVVFTDIELVR